ncbi:hypothetical protein BIY37_04705 [Candidatus Brocadia sapporoensis]|uniref:Uncharacterized protein n=1 Tax=Candidatus Brocadia sapporoensis TaxID=392547 RepID=A0A1V6M132_9BACT|nr:hypothetical protein [Candidatus Brocadia sapporoensis]MDG6005535.1 hypothetical protein [Candidatus Brocadia sp.]OQD46124.1 hypothetical protein BIY37_04705 [Candidatus Brocadia sapporoensis]GJQ23589.1 MAG: hypothetical protein HBSAPP01_13790 [Candidatus Brocadia sapporoensis]
MGDDCSVSKYCDVALKLEEIHGEIKSQLSSGNEIMKAMRASQEAFADRVEKIVEKQDQRIVSMEKKVWYASGGMSAGVAAITAAIAKFFGGGNG